MTNAVGRGLVLVAVLATLLSASLWAQAPAPAKAIVLRAGSIVDPDAGTVTASQSILVENGTITAIGATVAAPADATVIDLSRDTLMPGLVDAHTHLCMEVDQRRDGGNYFHTVIHDPDTFRSVEGVVNARTMLEAGFTSVRDVGNEGNYACSSVRVGIDRGLIPGPTMLNAGRIIAPYGGQFHLQPDRPDIAGKEYFFADTRDEMMKGVRENAQFGAKVIKIVVDDQPYIYSVDDIKFIIEEAARAKLKVAAHVWTTAGAHNASVAGVASMEHLNGATEDDLQTAKANGVTAVFTPFPLPELQRFRTPDRAQKEFDTEVEQLKKGLRTGIPIAFGTDCTMNASGMTRGQTALQWIDSYVAAGFTPAAIVKAMTTNGTRLLGVDKERGTLRAGMAADIIATPDNPLQRIDALKSVNFVMKNGVVVRQP